VTGGFDRAAIDHAVAEAKARNPASDSAVFDFLSNCSRSNYRRTTNALARPEFIIRFQQLTGPRRRKGVEDTAFYNFHRLIR